MSSTVHLNPVTIPQSTIPVSTSESLAQPEASPTTETDIDNDSELEYNSRTNNNNRNKTNNSSSNHSSSASVSDSELLRRSSELINGLQHSALFTITFNSFYQLLQQEFDARIRKQVSTAAATTAVTDLDTSVAQYWSDRCELINSHLTQILSNRFAADPNKLITESANTVAAAIGSITNNSNNNNKSTPSFTGTSTPQIIDIPTPLIHRQTSSQSESADGPGSGHSRKGFLAVQRLSSKLTAMLGYQYLSRPAVVKLIWQYIKSKGLQSSNDRRIVECDLPLQQALQVESFKMTELNGLLSKQLMLVSAATPEWLIADSEAKLVEIKLGLQAQQFEQKSIQNNDRKTELNQSNNNNQQQQLPEWLQLTNTTNWSISQFEQYQQYLQSQSQSISQSQSQLQLQLQPLSQQSTVIVSQQMEMSP